MTASTTTARIVFVVAVVTVAAVAAVMAGCNQTSRLQPVGDQGQRLELVAQTRPPILDLPVPIGFSLDERRSRNFAGAVARYVDHLYKGRADKFAVGRFYKRNMPISRWVLVTEIGIQGDITLDFEKRTERCRIIVSKGDWLNTVHVKAQLWTTGRIIGPAAGVTNAKTGTTR